MNDKPAHPFAHVKSAQLYEWMRQDCAALVEARQSREDNLVQTITQISSAALLAIPGFLLTANFGAPSFEKGWLLYVGAGFFVSALIASMLEQHFSAKAYKVHEAVVQKFYLLESLENCDQRSIDLVDRLRVSACILFALAVLMSAFGLAFLMGEHNGKSTSSATTSSASASLASTSVAGVRGSGSAEVGTVADSLASEEVTAKRQ